MDTGEWQVGCGWDQDINSSTLFIPTSVCAQRSAGRDRTGKKREWTLSIYEIPDTVRSYVTPLTPAKPRWVGLNFLTLQGRNGSPESEATGPGSSKPCTSHPGNSGPMRVHSPWAEGAAGGGITQRALQLLTDQNQPKPPGLSQEAEPSWRLLPARQLKANWAGDGGGAVRGGMATCPQSPWRHCQVISEMHLKLKDCCQVPYETEFQAGLTFIVLFML